MRTSLRRVSKGRGALIAAVAVAATLATASPALAAPNTLGFNNRPSAPWGEVGGPSKIANGVLTTSEEYSYFRLDYPNGEWNAAVDEAVGWAIETRVKVDPASPSTCGTNIWANDLTNLIMFGFAVGKVCLVYPNVVDVGVDTTSAFRTYRFEVRAGHLRILVDGDVKADVGISPGGGGSEFLGFGNIEFSTPTIKWDYFSYDVSIGNPPCTIVGTALDDVIHGTPGNDLICAGRGNDVVYGGGGNDTLVGGFGKDRLYGGAGSDVLAGSDGDDLLDGQAGTDTCNGGRGTDRATAACERVSGVP